MKNKPNLHPQLESDLRYAFSWFPLASLILLRESAKHLIREKFEDGPNGCIFNLLSRVLPEEERIRDKSSLTLFFTGGSGRVHRKYPEMECYQPARNLVRLWDGQSSTVRPADRYGDTRELQIDTLMAFLDGEIPRRKELEAEACEVAESVERRLMQGSH